jgi:PAS domain S-box-containing protein
MRGKILLVDDEAAILTILGMSLEDLGYEVATASSGEEALERISTCAPDVVLSDIKMPGIDGIELLKRIKASHPEIEVIMISGHGDMDLAIASLQFNATDFLTKPVPDPLLQKALSRTFEKIGLHRQVQEYTRNLERLVAEKSARVVELERRLAVGQVVDGLTGVMKGLVESFDQGQSFFSELPCYISVHSRDLKVAAVNQLFRERLGDQLGRSSCAVFPNRGPDSCPIQATLASGKGQRRKACMLDAGGREIPVVVHTAPIMSQEGGVEMVIAIAVDVSEVSRLQEDLRATRERYQRLFDAVPCYTTVIDRDFRIAECNQRYRDDFGECRQRACHEVFVHRDDVCPDCPIQRTFMDGRSHQTETVVTVKDGTQRNVLIWSAPLFDPTGHVDQVLEIATDITQMRKLQDNLSLLGLMIGSMSHGVKGILTSLDGGIYKVETGRAKGDQKRVEEGWAMVRDKAARIKKTVLDILYYAKSREMGLARLDIGEFAAQVASIVRPKAQARGIAFHVGIPADLGSMEMDEMAMSAALVNFLENSVDACSDDLGKNTHAVMFKVRSEGEDIVFDIIDDGMGMEQETKEKMFTLFFSSKGAKGTGLGLYISNQVVQQHGGRICVESEFGSGTAITVTLPRRRPAETLGAGNGPAAASPPLQSALGLDADREA